MEETLVDWLRRERPDVVITFHPSGISFHPDHRVLTLATIGAILGSGDPDWYRDCPAVPAPHRPARLYAWVPNRAAPYWKDWPRRVYAATPAEITTVIDTAATADVKWRAIEAHASQRDGPPFRQLHEAGAFREECFVRLLPSLPGGAAKETDLLEGLS
jgi:LmbE family N-acetylglucosaminyl deacetylase